ncbi:hypothetical protein ACX27_09870 [Nostoc piscinale CENA21]|uniref:Uncharacterized protein n=1 Tax=Nostoc piscinale CENA21 TaxID=224013 RepID=A0A0M3V512_9NOSO|nr:hypothetical protein ACX27_09870 [Nostoc piscinale CENA21]
MLLIRQSERIWWKFSVDNVDPPHATKLTKNSDEKAELGKVAFKGDNKVTSPLTFLIFFL